MTTSKKTTQTRADLSKTAVKDASINTKTTPEELSDDELKIVSGGKHVSNIKWTPGNGAA